jgi:Mu transposase, C-terminal.
MDLDSTVGRLASIAIGTLLIGRLPTESIARETVRTVVWQLTQRLEPAWRRMHARQRLLTTVMSYLRWTRTDDSVVVGFEVDLGEGRRADLVLETSEAGVPRSIRIEELKLRLGLALDPKVEAQVDAYLRLGQQRFGDAFTGVHLICLGDHRRSLIFSGKEMEMKKVDTAQWTIEEQRLRRHKQSHGSIPASMARAAAGRLNIHERSVWRKLQTPPRARKRFELEDRHQLAVVTQGTIRAAVIAAQSEGDKVCESTFRARWRELPSGVRNGLRYGVTAMQAHQGYAQYEADEPNDVVQADTKFPAVMCRERKEWLALSKEDRELVPEPKLRIFGGIDDKTRYMRMSDVDITPVNAEVVKACMADAVRGEIVDATFIGGAIKVYRWDNALEQLAEEVTVAAERLGAEQVAPVMPFAGWMKGKIERVWRTQDDEFWSRLPGWYGDDESPFVKALPADELMTCAEIRTAYNKWEANYNQKRIHGSIKSTPLDAWRAAAVEILMPEPFAIAMAYYHTIATKKVRTLGVSFRDRIYAAVALGDIVGEEVQIAYSRRDPSFIYVLRDGDYFCTAKDSALLTDNERNGIYAHREAGSKLVVAIRQGAVDSTSMKATRDKTDVSEDEPAQSAEDELLAFLEQSIDDEDPS